MYLGLKGRNKEKTLVYTSMDFGYQQNARNFFTCGGTIGFSKNSVSWN